MEPTNWTPEHSAALRDYLVSGMSYAEIARAINAKFKTSYSRSATLGRARRMGLAGSERPREETGQPSKSRQMSLHHLRERFASTAKWFVPIFERVELTKLRCVEIEPRHLSLIELEAGDCRYPCGGGEEGEPITFCGHPRREDSSYCVAHFHLTCGPDAQPERRVSAAPLRIVRDSPDLASHASLRPGESSLAAAQVTEGRREQSAISFAELVCDVARRSF
jgi:GcrA cell cycle regulator